MDNQRGQNCCSDAAKHPSVYSNESPTSKAKRPESALCVAKHPAKPDCVQPQQPFPHEIQNRLCGQSLVGAISDKIRKQRIWI